MKTFRILLIIAVLLLALFLPSNASAAQSGGDNGSSFAASEILVKFKPDVSASEVAEIHRQYGGQVKEIIPSIGVQVVTIPACKALEKARAYSAHGKVLYAEPDYLAEAIGAPDDAYFDNQWGMKKVEAPAAWDVTKGNSTIKIAILDTGVDLDHPDLAGKITANTNFSTSTTTDDIYGHGTHVAGIAAASTNNGIGVAGLGYSASIVSVKVLGDSGSGYYSWVANGIVWATDNGAQVINMSLGGASVSSTLEDAVNYAWSKGVVVVAAAGNSGSSAPFYPAYYSNTIAIAATDASDKLASWSNYGDWVDVAAPGVSIYSTLIDAGYGYKSGTSMASPHAAGLAALVYSVVTDLDGNGRLNDEVRSRIETTADNISSVGAGSGRINAYMAVSGSATPSMGSITGKVINSASGLPITGATVTNGVSTASTDSSGAYILTSVAPESYIVIASAVDCSSASQNVSVVARQTATANFALTSLLPPVSKAMWVDSINFRVTGKNLRFEIKIVSDSGAVTNAQVTTKLEGSAGQSWTFSGTTDNYGVASFTLQKAPAGNYVATVTSLTASGYFWNKAKGVNSASYTFDGGNGK